MIQIKRVYDTHSSKDGKRILVDRLWPRGIRKNEAKIDEWLKDIAPSDELRKWFAHDPIKWPEFKKRYQKELKSKSVIVEKLRKEARAEIITLMYAAKDEDHNNAVALKEILQT